MSRGYFGIGIWKHQHSINAGSLFRSAEAFNADFVFTIGRKYKKTAADVTNATGQIPCFNYISGDDFLAHIPLGARLVCVEISDNSAKLQEFVHPDKAVYLLGHESDGIPKKITDKGIVVTIPSEFCLNVAAAGSIALYDRIAKAYLKGRNERAS